MTIIVMRDIQKRQGCLPGSTGVVSPLGVSRMNLGSIVMKECRSALSKRVGEYEIGGCYIHNYIHLGCFF